MVSAVGVKESGVLCVRAGYVLKRPGRARLNVMLPSRHQRLTLITVLCSCACCVYVWLEGTKSSQAGGEGKCINSKQILRTKFERKRLLSEVLVSGLELESGVEMLVLLLGSRPPIVEAGVLGSLPLEAMLIEGAGFVVLSSGCFSQYEVSSNLIGRMGRRGWASPRHEFYVVYEVRAISPEGVVASQK